MSQKVRMAKTCTITRNPATGETAVITIVEGLACTTPYPIESEAGFKRWGATDFDGFELFAEEEASVQNGDILTTNSITYTIQRRPQRWNNFMTLLLRQRT